MPFTPGEHVKFLNEAGGGVIVKLLDNQRVLVCDDHGFEFEMKKSDIVADGKSVIDVHDIHEKLNAFSDAGRDSDAGDGVSDYSKIMLNYLMASKPYWTSKDQGFIEIDLHIEELIDKPAFMNDGQKLHYQLQYARHCLEEAHNIKIRRLIFIHGVGAGVLRHELREWLKSLDYVEIVNANYQRYGIGATEAKVYY